MTRTPVIASPAKRGEAISSFAKSVYRVVRTIPSGQVRSYKWVAEKVGRPKAYRAVGQVLKRNPATCGWRGNSDPKTIPCHRVIRSDGTLGGYAWGIRRKKQLLEKEIGRLSPLP